MRSTKRRKQAQPSTITEQENGMATGDDADETWENIHEVLDDGLTIEDEESGTFTIREQDNGIARGDCENDGDDTSENIHEVLEDGVAIDDKESGNTDINDAECIPPPAKKSRNTMFPLQTSMARCIAEVTGLTDEVAQFDQLHTTGKNLKLKHTNTSKQKLTQVLAKHDRKLAALQSAVLTKHTELSQQIKEYEQTHLKEQNFPP